MLQDTARYAHRPSYVKDRSLHGPLHHPTHELLAHVSGETPPNVMLLSRAINSASVVICYTAHQDPLFARALSPNLGVTGQVALAISAYP
jgi:hypothetical protein